MNENRCYTVKDQKREFSWVLIGGKYRISKKSFDLWLDGSGSVTS